MEISLDSHSGYQITACTTDHIDINHKSYHDHVLLTCDNLIHPWKISDFNTLCLDDFKPILTPELKVVLLGYDDYLEHYPHQLIVAFQQRGIGIEVMPLASACRTFNVLVSEGRDVAAGLIFTSQNVD